MTASVVKIGYVTILTPYQTTASNLIFFSQDIQGLQILNFMDLNYQVKAKAKLQKWPKQTNLETVSYHKMVKTSVKMHKAKILPRV